MTKPRDYESEFESNDVQCNTKTNAMNNNYSSNLSFSREKNDTVVIRNKGRKTKKIQLVNESTKSKESATNKANYRKNLRDSFTSKAVKVGDGNVFTICETGKAKTRPLRWSTEGKRQDEKQHCSELPTIRIEQAYWNINI